MVDQRDILLSSHRLQIEQDVFSKVREIFELGVEIRMMSKKTDEFGKHLLQYVVVVWYLSFPARQYIDSIVLEVEHLLSSLPLAVNHRKVSSFRSAFGS